MVIPLPDFSRPSNYKYAYPIPRLPTQKGRRQVISPSYSFVALTYFFPDCLQEVGEEPRDQDPGEHGKFKQIFKQKNVHLLAFWSLAYVGLEFTIGGQCYVTPIDITV